MASVSGTGLEARRPPNFSWVVDGLLAALAFPRDEHHYLYLQRQGIDYLVCLTQSRIPSVRGNTELEVIHIGMPDFTAPSLNQVEKFIRIVDKTKSEGKRLAIHCQMGRGRTGTMAACYLMHHQGISAKQAIKEIRRLRPGSIETIEQEALVYKFEENLK